MVAAIDLRLVLVTPETTLLDEPVRSLQFPLYDGQMGVLPGRAPMVGRLGAGVLKLDPISGESQRFFIDGGFVQIKGSVVSLLTHRAVPVSEIDAEQAAADLKAALQQVAVSDAEIDARQQMIDRARRMIAVSRLPR